MTTIPSPAEPRALVAELERQVERGSMFNQAVFQKSFTRLSTVEAVVWELVDQLLEHGVVSAEDLPGASAAQAEAEARVRAVEDQPGMMRWPAVAIRVDPTDPAAPEPVDCAARMNVCQGVCCRLKFALSQDEVEAGVVKWDIGHPYVIRHDSTGYCSHNNQSDHACSVYNDRPTLCRRYSCRDDARIWSDFDGMVLNQTWIDDHLAGGDAILLVDDDAAGDGAADDGAAFDGAADDGAVSFS